MTKVRVTTKYFCSHCTACKDTIRQARVPQMLQSLDQLRTGPVGNTAFTATSLRQVMHGWMDVRSFSPPTIQNRLQWNDIMVAFD